MREIKFRAIDAVSGKGWVTGELVHNQKVTTTGLEPRTMVGGYEVSPATVGQFTGLCDRYGMEIYEGDIVQWNKDRRLYVVEFRRGMFYASVEPCNPHIYGGFPLWFLCEEEQHCIIVGNCHDNPELLKKK